MELFLRFIIIMSCLLTSHPALAEGKNSTKWAYFYIFPGQTLYDVFKELVIGGMHAKSFDEFKTIVVERNKLSHPDKLEAGEMLLVPVPAKVEMISKITKKMEKNKKKSEGRKISYHSPYYWSVLPYFGYSKLKSRESKDASRATLLSEKNLGIAGNIEYVTPYGIGTRYYAGAVELEFKDNQDKEFESNKVRLHTLGAEKTWIRQSGLTVFVGILAEESPYLSAVSSSKLVIDPVMQPGVSFGLGYRYLARKFSLSVELLPRYLFSAHGSTFRVRNGAGYKGVLNLRYWLFDEFAASFFSWYDHKILRSSIATHVTTEVAAGIQFTIR